MKRIIETGLTKPKAPHEWAVAAHGMLYSVHVPIRPDGTIESGSAERQAEVAFADLLFTLRAAGAGTDDIVLMEIFLTSLDHKAVVDEVYRRSVGQPFPVRACLAVSGLPTPGTMIEIVATTALPR